MQCGTRLVCALLLALFSREVFETFQATWPGELLAIGNDPRSPTDFDRGIRAPGERAAASSTAGFRLRTNCQLLEGAFCRTVPFSCQ